MNPLNKVLSALVLGGALAVSSVAFAQDEAADAARRHRSRT
jgi:hypothetical protein